MIDQLEPVRRTLKHDDKYSESAERIFGSHREADEALRAAEHVIASHPHIDRYPKVADTRVGPLFGFKTKATEHFPAVVIFYTVSDDGQSATLWDIIPAEPDQ